METPRYEIIPSKINNEERKEEIKEVLVCDPKYKKALKLEDEELHSTLQS